MPIPNNSAPNIRYLPQLDTLRAMAVFLVLLLHWLPLPYWLETGAMGVTLFFVLSGYLITKILLKAKDQTSASHTRFSAVIKQFYIRRALRIFPIYFITVTILILLNYHGIREKMTYYILYVMNYIHPVGMTTHLWSLSVEEQYYLFWPLLLLLFPKGKELYLMLALIGIGIIFRMSFLLVGAEDYLLALAYTPACFDAFGFGGLLAYSQLRGIKIHKNWLIAILIISSLFYGLSIYCGMAELKFSLFRFSLSGFSFLAIYYLTSATLGGRHVGLINKALIKMGKISYGIYLYHNFVPEIYLNLHRFAVQHQIRFPLVNKLVFPIFNERWQMFPIYFFVTIGISLLSWHLIEDPINKLKKFFPYLPR